MRAGCRRPALGRPGTVDLLRFLLRRIATTHSLVVGTLRPDEIDPSHPLRALLGDAARSPDAVSVVLPPLSTAAIRSLVERGRWTPSTCTS